MITTEILAAYYQHKLNFIDTHTSEQYEMMALYDDSVSLYSESMPTETFYIDGRTAFFKPILRPLSELEPYFNKYLKPYWYDFDYFCECIINQQLTYSEFVELLKQHYNVFNLPDGEYVKKV